jgi:hypothetical membrane protein
MSATYTVTDTPDKGALLKCGILVGLLFNGTVLLQSAVRPGFDLRTLPLSLLSLGSFGWVQTLNFIISGVLIMGCAAGLRRAVPSRAGAFASAMLLLYGVGLAAAGIFPADPVDGFPIGSRRAEVMTWHANLHGLAFAVAHLGIVLAAITFAARFGAQGLKRWAALSAATAAIIPALIILGFSNAAVIGLAFFMTGVVGMSWLGLVAWHLDKRRDA